jgi:hypothetical protein
MNKARLERNTNRLLVHAWKSGDEIVIVDSMAKKRIFLKVDAIKPLEEGFDDETCYGMNGYRRVKRVEDILTEYEESQ